MFSKANMSAVVFADQNTTSSDTEQGLEEQRAIRNLLAVLLSQITSGVKVFWEQHNNSASEPVFINFYTV